MLSGKILFAEQAGTYVLKFVGDVRLTLCSTLDQFLATTLESDNFEGSAELQELEVMQESEERVRERVLDAHRALMDLNENNREAFRDLVRSLENEL